MEGKKKSRRKRRRRKGPYYGKKDIYYQRFSLNTFFQSIEKYMKMTIRSVFTRNFKILK